MKKRLLSAVLTVLLAASLTGPAALCAPYDEDTVIGRVPALTASNTGHGSLTDQSPLGSAAADAAIYATGAQLAVLCGGDLAGNLLPGERTYGELLWAFRNDPRLVQAQVTAAQLKTLLEFCLSRITVDLETKRIDREASAFDAFPQVGGCTVEYDASAPAGERVRQIRLAGGEILDWTDGEAYALVCPEPLLAGGYGSTGLALAVTPTDLTVCQALARFLADGQMGEYLDSARITVVGVTDSTLAERYGVAPILLAAALLVMVVFGLKKYRQGG